MNNKRTIKTLGKEEYKRDKKICSIFLLIFIGWLIILFNPKLFFILAIIWLIIKPILFVMGCSTVLNTEENNGKDGYYAQYGVSFGANARKHEQYTKDKIAREVMDKK